jgi:hypothetical protein
MNRQRVPESKSTASRVRAPRGVHARAVVPANVHEALRTPGQPLDALSTTYFESRFGEDFSRIRVHSGREAVVSAAAMNARAFTVGRHLVFGSGQYAPTTPRGRLLLAHELTHALQDAQGEAPEPGRLHIGSTSAPEEAEATREPQPRRCACGGTVTTGGECARCRKRRLATGGTPMLWRQPQDAGPPEDPGRQLQVACVIRLGGCPS